MDTDILHVLLDEFKYRHGLFWKIVFRFSYVILTLYTIPFLKLETGKDLGTLAKGFPVAGFGLCLGGVVLLVLEYRLLSFVEEKYNDCKEKLAKGCSNTYVMNHKYVGYYIIALWAGFLGGLGILEYLYLSG